jgi:hypothetical protein
LSKAAGVGLGATATKLGNACQAILPDAVVMVSAYSTLPFRIGFLGEARPAIGLHCGIKHDKITI